MFSRRLLFVPDGDALLVGKLFGVEHRIGDAGLLLFLIVLEGDEGVAAENGDGHEVHDSHEGHEQVGQVPHEGQGGQRAEGHHADAEGAEDEEPDGLFAEELDIAFTVVVVASTGAEGEHEHHDGDEHTGEAAEFAAQSELHEGHALLTGIGIAVEQENDAGGGGADDHGVYEHAESLNQTLLHRMAHMGGGGGVGHGTHTGFVGEEAALGASEDSGGDTADSGVRREGLGHDGGDHAGHFGDVQDDDDKGHEQVGSSHEGHEPAAEGGDALDAAEDDHAGDGSEGDADGILVDAELGVQGVGDGVGLHRVEAHAEGHGNEDGEERGRLGIAEAVLDVVGGAAAEAAGERIAYLVDLGERAFHKAGSGAEQSDDPHPEDGAGAAYHDSDGDAGDVAHTHTGSGTDAEGLEGADMTAFLAGTFLEQAAHFTEHGKLGEFDACREIQAKAHQHADEHIRPEYVVRPVDETFDDSHSASTPWRK